MKKPLGEEMEFFRQYNEVLFNQLEKKVLDLETANQQLRILAKEYQLQFNNVSDVVFMIGADLNILNVSPSVEKLLGYKSEDFIGRHAYDLRHIFTSESFERAIANISKMLEGKRIPATIYEVIAKDETLRCVEIHGSPLIRDGQVAGTISVARDITERKLIEEKLRESEGKYRELVKFAPAGIYEVDYETNLFTSVNDVVCEYTGYTRDELLTMNLFNLLTEESQQLMRERLKKLMANENISQTVEYCIKTKGREELWVRLSARYIYESGKLKGATGVVYNITERKRAEESLKETELKFRTIFDSASEGILLLNVVDGKFSEANEKICNMLGYTKDELLDLGIQDIHPAETVPFVIDQSEKQLKKEILVAKNIPVMKKGKTIFFADISSSPITLEGKECLLGMFRDISERKQAEEALKESEKRYRELSIIDDLTQLYNSKHFHAQLEIEIERSNSIFYGQPLTLLLLDLDKFKEFNDTYGHVEGDYVLSRFGRVIKRCLREVESAYRYGGGEYAIILPMTSIEEGIVKAKRIQAELRKETFSPMLDQNINITVSIGLAQYKPMEEMKMFVHRVEKLMYKAKKDGSDKICYDISGDKHSFIGS